MSPPAERQRLPTRRAPSRPWRCEGASLSTSGASFFVPVALAQLLDGIVTKVTVVGSEDLDGVPSTHFRLEIDADHAEAPAAADIVDVDELMGNEGSGESSAYESELDLSFD